MLNRWLPLYFYWMVQIQGMHIVRTHMITPKTAQIFNICSPKLVNTHLCLKEHFHMIKVESKIKNRRKVHCSRQEIIRNLEEG